jgi:DNA adenine methylase
MRATLHLDHKSKYKPFIDKLQGVQILNRDAMSIIPKFDLPNVLIYIDPPYEEVRENKFRQYTDVDHNKLFEIISKFEHAKWAISNYGGGPYDERYKDYRCVTRASTNSSLTGSKGNVGKDKNVVEALWCNF